MKNNLPEGQWWLRVETIGGGEWDVSSGNFPDPRKYYLPVIEQCAYSSAQAERGILPDCVKACPVDAMRFGERDRPDSRVASDLQAPGATDAGNPPGSAFTVTYLPARTQARQRRSGYVQA
jgi:Fe-S-cluster-containing dehydrogenase component